MLLLVVFLAACETQEDAPAPWSVDIEAYNSHLETGGRSLLSDPSAAIASYTAAIEVNPHGHEAYIARGVSYEVVGNWHAAIADYEKARELEPTDFSPWMNIAMLRAACPDVSIRDGSEAVACAKKACDLDIVYETHRLSALETLACAYAEAGNWQAAVEICEKQLANSNDELMANVFRQRLELFEQQKPYRKRAAQASTD